MVATPHYSWNLVAIDPNLIGAIDPARLYILAVSLQHAQSDADCR